MLSESYVASTLSCDASSRAAAATKNAAISIQPLHPNAATTTAPTTAKACFKNSSTAQNGLAVSATHVFAAQHEKAVVHVYSRERQHQEAIVPFPERIQSVAFAGDYAGGAGFLVLGTQGGRVIVWEVCTGRRVSTPPSHLQPVTALAVEPACNHLLSGSEDSNVHVWSLPALLSFTDPSRTALSTASQSSPVRTLANHHAPVTSLVVGHSGSFSNIGISGSQDRTCIVWDYHTGDLLRTVLLSHSPTCLALDPCDRAFYAGHEDGSIQLFDFYGKSAPVTHPLHDERLRARAAQASPSQLWGLPSLDLGSTLCLAVVYEGNYVISGHQGGKVCQWDVSSGKFVKELADHGSPVTNVQALPVVGFHPASAPRLTVHQVVKPRYDPSFAASGEPENGIAPLSYTLTAQFTSALPQADVLPASSMQMVEAAMTQPSFPASFLDASLSQLGEFTRLQVDPASGAKQQTTAGGETVPEAQQQQQQHLQRRVDDLQSQLQNLRSVHQQTWKTMVDARMAKARSRKDAEPPKPPRRSQDARRRPKRVVQGGHHLGGGREEEEDEGEEDSLNEDSNAESDPDRPVESSADEAEPKAEVEDQHRGLGKDQVRPISSVSSLPPTSSRPPRERASQGQHQGQHQNQGQDQDQDRSQGQAKYQDQGQHQDQNQDHEMKDSIQHSSIP